MPEIAQHAQPASAGAEPTVSQAVVLGLVQGPAELLPVSSSAHAIAIPALLGWDWDAVDPELRKELEVALHAGGGLALLLPWGRLLRDELRGTGSLVALALSALPAAIAGLAGEQRIGEEAGRPLAVAAGLVAGGLALVFASSSPVHRHGPLNPADGLALGVAQAVALLPGVSRSGSTVTAARRRGFGAGRSGRISAAVGLPVVAGAAALKTFRLASRLRKGGREGTAALAAGAAASLVSTAMAVRVLGPAIRADRPGLAFAYRVGLAAAIATVAASRTREPLRG